MSTQDLILLISAAVGIIISVGFKLIPVLDRLFYSISADWRGLSMVGMVAVASLGVFGFSCSGLFPSVSCTQQGALELLKAFLIMVSTNQVTNLVTKDSTEKKVLVAKAQKVQVQKAAAATNKAIDKAENKLPDTAVVEKAEVAAPVEVKVAKEVTKSASADK
jgi:hypothetical protein